MTADAAPDLGSLRDLQSRALEAVARQWARQPAGPPVDAPDPGGSRRALRRAAEVTGHLAEAARQVASAATAAPGRWTQATETADAISTTAQALRMLAELELAAIPGP